MDDNARLAVDLLRWSGDRSTVPSHQPGADGMRWLASRKIDSLFHLATGTPGTMQALYDKVWHVQRAEAVRVLAALADAGLAPLVFKGAELLQRAYSPHSINLLADIDLLVDRTEISRAKPVMYALGYRQALYDRESGSLTDRDIADVAAIESTHYELAPFSRLVPIALTEEETAIASELDAHPLWATARGEAFVAVEIDMHHAVATDLESGPFFERAVGSSFQGARTFGPADHVWFTATRLYNEVAIHGKVSLRDFAYLAPLLANEEIDWEVVLSAAREHHLHPSLFYYLGFLDFLNPGVVPGDVIAELDPIGTERMRDWGWQLEKLFGVLPAMPLA